MFSALAQDFIKNRRNRGLLEEATHVGVAGVPGDGPFCILYLKVTDRIIERSSYESNGCPTSMASGGVLAQLITGRELSKVAAISAADLTNLIAPVPDGKSDCPARAVEALHKALASACELGLKLTPE